MKIRIEADSERPPCDTQVFLDDVNVSPGLVGIEFKVDLSNLPRIELVKFAHIKQLKMPVEALATLAQFENVPKPTEDDNFGWYTNFNNLCCAEGCTTTTHRFMCNRHWSIVPDGLKKRLKISIRYAKRGDDEARQKYEENAALAIKFVKDNSTS